MYRSIQSSYADTANILSYKKNKQIETNRKKSSFSMNKETFQVVDMK